MELPKRILLLVFILAAHLTNGQTDICECCAYSSLKFKNDYEDILPTTLIKTNKVRLITVYTQGTDEGSNQSTDKYKEMKFKFDQNGQIISRTEYNRNGKPHSVYEFVRNGAGKIVQESFSYLDSLEQKSKTIGFSTPDITDYYYDSKNRLIKSKQRDAKAKSLADEISDYTKYKYDEKGRKIKEIRQYYYGESGPQIASVYSSTYKYNNNNFNGESTTYIDNKPFLTTRINFNKKWKPLKESVYNNLVNSAAEETNYQYDEFDRLIKFETIAGNGSASECPDGGTFTEFYEYNNGRLSRIIHSYENKKCIMSFEYE